MNPTDDDKLLLLDDDVTPTKSSGTRWKILIVDDDADVHHSTEFSLCYEIIENCGLHFLRVYSATEGLGAC